MKLEITPQDVAGVARDVHARLVKPSLPHHELAAVLAELRAIKHSITALVPRVRSAIGIAVDDTANIKMTDILKLTAASFDVTEVDILSARRNRSVVRPRHIAMYLCRTLTPRSYGEIAMFFGDRDHTTILHAVHRVIQLMDQDAQLSQEIGLLADKVIKREIDA